MRHIAYLKRPIGSIRCEWGDNIKMDDTITYLGYGRMSCILEHGVGSSHALRRAWNFFSS